MIRTRPRLSALVAATLTLGLLATPALATEPTPAPTPAPTAPTSAPAAVPTPEATTEATTEATSAPTSEPTSESTSAPTAEPALAGILAASATAPRARAATARRQDGRGTYEQGVVRRVGEVDDFDDVVEGLPNTRRLARVHVTQDLQAQRVVARATFRATPSAADESLVAVWLGQWDGDSCVSKFSMLGAAVQKSAVAAGVNGNALGATNTGVGTMTLTSAPHVAIRSGAWECAFARVLDVNDTNNVLQTGYAVDLEDQKRPVLRVDSDEDRVVGARRNKKFTVRVEVRNVSESSAPGTVVRAAGKGLKITNPVRRVGTLEDRSSEYLKFTVRKKKTKGTRKLTVRATSGSVSAQRSFTVVTPPKPRRPRSIVGRYYWGHETTSLTDSSGWRTHAVHFVNKKFAHLDFAGEGTRTRCARASKQCVRYRWNRATGKVRIGGRTARLTTEGFRMKPLGDKQKIWFSPLHLPKKGSRLGLDLTHQNWSGVCMIMCTTWTRFLTMDRRGRFVDTGYSIGSWPGLGSSWSTVSPEEKGTYRFIRKGLVELRYANGTVKRRMFGVNLDLLGRPDPSVGVMLGDVPYY